MGSATSKAKTSSGGGGATPDFQLDRSLLNRIEDAAADKPAPTTAAPAAPAVGASRQVELDASIQAKIRDELAKLRAREAEVRAQIEAALERENIERQRGGGGGKKGGAGGGGEGGSVGGEKLPASSDMLRQRLEEVKAKLESYRERRHRVGEGSEEVDRAKQRVVECYRSKPDRTLDCWAEVQGFRQAVSKAEKDFVASLAATA